MSILGKVVSKIKRGKGRVSGVDRFERNDASPIIFMTNHGGSHPLDYDNGTKKFIRMKEEGLACLNKAIAADIIDEYSDLSVFEEIIDANAEMVKNDLKNQNITRKSAGRNIKVVTKETLFINEREISRMEEMMGKINDAKEEQD